MTHASLVVVLLFAVSTPQAPSATPSPSPSPVPFQAPPIEGVRNYTRVDATIGCAGATEVKALPGIAKLGYRAVLNLREATEAGVSIDESRAAAEAAGLKYIHLPLKGSAPDVRVADEFLKLVADPANQPLFIHCGSANRVAALWLIKRMVIDKWTEERSLAEAKVIGLSNEALKKFALDYVASPRL